MNWAQKNTNNTKRQPVGKNNIISYLNIYHMLGINLREFVHYSHPFTFLLVICSDLWLGKIIFVQILKLAQGYYKQEFLKEYFRINSLQSNSTCADNDRRRGIPLILWPLATFTPKFSLRVCFLVSQENMRLMIFS